MSRMGLERMKKQPFQKPGIGLRILRRLRSVVVSNHNSQFKLDRIVRLFSADLSVDVCSLYILTKENFLLLSSTWGLDEQYIHKTRLHISEGLVGEVARTQAPLYVSLAKDHPKFLLKPETGEENLKTFLGIPIVQREKVIGILTFRTKDKRLFEKWEVELLEVSAVVIADIVKKMQKEIQEENYIFQDISSHTHSIKAFNGQLFSEGSSAYGRALIYGETLPSFKPLSSLSEKESIKQLHKAINILCLSINELKSSWKNDKSHMDLDLELESSRQIFDVYTMLLEDPSWKSRIESYIKKGFTPAASALNVQQDMEFQFSKISNTTSAWILEDLKDITQKLLFILQNNKQLSGENLADENIIVVAKSLGPGDLLTLKSFNIKALIIENSGPSSHVVFLARSLGLPVLGWVNKLIENVKPTDYILLDTKKKRVILNPDPQVFSKIQEKERAENKNKETIFSTLKLKNACSQNGYEVFANLGLLEEISKIQSLHVSGIGLMRTEILFMQEPELPSVSAQEIYYGKVISSFKGRHCCIRTLDIGGDKKLPYMNLPAEENPALGWRSIRISLDRLTIFKHQLRALIRSAIAHGPVDILLPFISTAEEFFECKSIYEKEIYALKLDKKPPVNLGIMVEVPSIVADLDRLKGEVDFLSVGTNDFFQFFFACDRNNPNISYRYSNMSYSFLKVLKDLREKAEKLNMSISICGDMASNDKGVQVLAAIGYRKFSVRPSSAAFIQHTLAMLDTVAWEKKMEVFFKEAKYSNFIDFLQQEFV